MFALASGDEVCVPNTQPSVDAMIERMAVMIANTVFLVFSSINKSPESF